MDHEGAECFEPTPPKIPIIIANGLKRSQLSILTAIILLFIILADWLFWDHPIGWTLGGYGLLLAVALFLRERKRPRGFSAWIIAAALACLCLQCGIEPGVLTVVLGALGLISLALILRAGWLADALTWAARWLQFAVIGWLTPLADLYTTSRLLRSEDNPGGRRWLRNWFLPLLLGMIFLILFTVANPVISQWIENVGTSIQELIENLTEHYPPAERIITWLLVGTGVWMLLRFHSQTKAPAWEQLVTGDGRPDSVVSPSIVTRCLLLFNMIFAVQIGLDVCYLWGGFKLPEGLTYAQYAHRGAYPLLAAGILAGLFVFAAFRGNPHDRRIRLARGLVLLWLAQNAFMLVSAAWRLGLYIDAYSLTRWRVAAAVWMLLVLCGVLWVIVRIAAGRSNLWLLNVNAVTALAVLFICSFCNIDGWIARYNTTHCREMHGHGEPLDVQYLESLGPDTLPALLDFAEKIEDRDKQQTIHWAIYRLYHQLENNLADWRGWTWQRRQLSQLEYPQAAFIPPAVETMPIDDPRDRPKEHRHR